MNFTCNECNDSGSRDKLGTYLDCNACDIATTRRDLNDFVKSLTQRSTYPTHPEDVALAIHQRALAMAPKQEAPKVVADDLAHEIMNSMAVHVDDWADGLDYEPSKTEVSGKALRYILSRAEPAAPAAANGALTDERAAFDQWSKPIPYVLFSDYAWQAWQARAILAAAGPDAALVKALESALAIINNEADPNEYAAPLKVIRAALSGAKGN